MSVCLITGGSSGIGRETALCLVKRGWTVYELSRRDATLPGTKHLRADVTDEEALRAAVESVVAAEERLDLVIHCAGFGISGAVEFTDTAEAQKQFDVNFFGMVRLNRLVLPILRRQGRGRIVALSSVAAPVPIPFQTYYSASKAAINAYTLALANEVRPYGVEVCAVQPGDIRTGFTAARRKLHDGDEAYGGRISRSVARMEHDEQNGMAPERAGAFIARVATRRRVSPIVTIGGSYKLVCLLIRLLPTGLANRIIGLLYAK